MRRVLLLLAVFCFTGLVLGDVTGDIVRALNEQTILHGGSGVFPQFVEATEFGIKKDTDSVSDAVTSLEPPMKPEDYLGGSKVTQLLEVEATAQSNEHTEAETDKTRGSAVMDKETKKHLKPTKPEKKKHHHKTEADCTKTVLIFAVPGSRSWNDEVRQSLLSTGQFCSQSVTVMFANDQPLTIDILKKYRAVLIYADYSFSYTQQMGDALTTYVSQYRGGVVTAVFAYSWSFCPTGAWATSTYTVLDCRNLPQTSGSTQYIGRRSAPNHPILANVNSFNGGSSSYRGTGLRANLRNGAQVIADWTDGEPLVIVSGNNSPVVHLNFFPPSSNSRGDFWAQSSDGEILLANALTFVMTPATPPSTASTLKCSAQSVATSKKFQCAVTPRDSNGNQLWAVNSAFSISASAGSVSWVDSDGFTLRFTYTAPSFVGTATISAAIATGESVGTAQVNIVTSDCSNTVLVHGATNSNWGNDVKQSLVDSGFFCSNSISFLDTWNVLTLDILKNYRTIIIFADSGFSYPAQMGDALNDWVTQYRGGVVLATFANTYNKCPQGKWLSSTYAIIDCVSNGQSQGTVLNIDLANTNRDHPLMEGVSVLNGGSSSYHSMGLRSYLKNGATEIARWSDGEPLVIASGNKSPVVYLNFYPVSSRMRGDFWDTNTDGARLLANAVLYVTVPPGKPSAKSTLRCPSKIGTGKTVTCTISATDDNSNVILARASEFAISTTGQSNTAPTPTVGTLFTFTATATSNAGVMSVRVTTSDGTDIQGSPAKVGVLAPDCSNTVLIYSPDSNDWMNNVKSSLVASGYFCADSISVLNHGTKLTPDLLVGIKTAFVHGDGQFTDPTTLGNTLKTFMDNGGSLVTAHFAYCANQCPQGSFMGSAYEVVACSGNPATSGSVATLGNIAMPNVGLTDNVRSYKGGSSSYRALQLNNFLRNGARVVATYQDGEPLIIFHPTQPVVHLNFFPVSDAMRADFWDRTTDGAQMIANAVLYVAPKTTTATATSILSCSGLQNNGQKASTCTIQSVDANGKPMFVLASDYTVVADSGSVSALSPASGTLFTFSYTPKSGALSDKIRVKTHGSNVVNSPMLVQLVQPNCDDTILIVSPDLDANPTWVADVKQSLVDSGFFCGQSISTMSSSQALSADILTTFDAVFIFADGGFNYMNEMGDALTKFVSKGGALVTATFAYTYNKCPQGSNWVNSAYPVLECTNNAQASGTQQTLQTVNIPNHPIMDGVSSFRGGSSSYRGQGFTLKNNAKVVATWSSGEPLVIVSGNGNPVVHLNFFPPSSKIRADFWDATTNGARLMANAITFGLNLGKPDTLSQVTCEDSTLPYGGQTTCFLVATNVKQGNVIALPSAFTVAATSGKASALAPAAPAYTFSFTYTAPSSGIAPSKVAVQVDGKDVIGSPIVIPVYGAPTAASSLSCVSKAVLRRGVGVATCTITVADANGPTSARSSDFVASAVNGGSISALSPSTPASSFTFTYTAPYTALTDSIQVALVDGTPIAGSPFKVRIAAGPSALSSVECDQVYLHQGNGTVCTINAKDSTGAPTLTSPSDFLVFTQAGGLTLAEVALDDNTLVFSYAAAKDAAADVLTVTLSSNHALIVGSPLNITIASADVETWRGEVDGRQLILELSGDSAAVRIAKNPGVGDFSAVALEPVDNFVFDEDTRVVSFTVASTSQTFEGTITPDVDYIAGTVYNDKESAGFTLSRI